MNYFNVYRFAIVPLYITACFLLLFLNESGALHLSEIARVFVIVLFCFSLFVSIGLSRRRLWAWKLNWSLLLTPLIYLFILLIGYLASDLTTSKDVDLQFVIELLILPSIYIVAWLVPNYKYFIKRRASFVDSNSNLEVVDIYGITLGVLIVSISILSTSGY